MASASMTLVTTPVPGQDFGGYHIERQLGEGGMGKVYEAVHRASGRRMALKVMLLALSSEKDRQRFLREGRMAASVNHPNVVYVFGSEEINGIPVIAMELVPGGALSDKIKAATRLPVTAATDVALQIIAGLEAAHAVGVLHRDIKPGNCFIASDGTVKVGDFGLSLSTQIRPDTRLTATGIALGTPAYASPEQLRGDDLDIASDIYSVGATLFHLLTGRPPFTAEDSVKLIANVLGSEPEPPHRLQPEIPAELSRVVVRCLAKDRKARFQSYAELRHALLPFMEAEPVPAPISRRLLAGFLDHQVAAAPAALLGAYWSGAISMEHSGGQLMQKIMPVSAAILVCLLWYFLYLAIPEGLWGAALGKTLCGLRVVGPNRRAPGLPRALLRTLVFMAARWCSIIAMFMGMSSILAVISVVALPLLFVTMRRRNGFAAIHDLLTRTRVVMRPAIQLRPEFGKWPGIKKQRWPALSTGAVESPAPAPATTLGPYEIRGRLWEQNDEELLLGFDLVLRRPLWIHVRPADAGPVSALRHDLSRPTRLRWVNCGETEARRWDAYEAMEGMPMVNCRAALPWNAVRFWLYDLAQEIMAAIRSPFTAPSFSFDRIWLTRNGYAVVLDFSCPGLPPNLPPAAEFAPRSLTEAQQFLDAAARQLLEGQPSTLLPATQARPLLRARVPLHALGFLKHLAQGTFERFDLVTGNLRMLTSTQAEISRGWRAASLALLPALFIVVAALVSLAIHVATGRMEQYWVEKVPAEPPEARQAALSYINTLVDYKVHQATKAEVESARDYLVAKDGPWLRDNVDGFIDRLGSLGQGEREPLRKRLEMPVPPPSVETINAPKPAYQPVVSIEYISIMWAMFILLMLMPLIFATIGMLGCLFAGFDPLLRLFGIGIVNRAGQPASRIRLLLRGLVVWVAAVASSILFGWAVLSISGVSEVFNGLQKVPIHSSHQPAWICLGVLALFTVTIVYCALRWPSRSLADRVTGTWLVPE